MLMSFSLDGVCNACYALIRVHPVLHNLEFPALKGCKTIYVIAFFLFVLSLINGILINTYKD